MVQATVEISEKTKQVLEKIKVRFKLKDTAQALEQIIHAYEKDVLEPALRPEFIQKMSSRVKEPTVPIKDFDKCFSL